MTEASGVCFPGANPSLGTLPWPAFGQLLPAV